MIKPTKRYFIYFSKIFSGELKTTADTPSINSNNICFNSNTTSDDFVIKPSSKQTRQYDLQLKFTFDLIRLKPYLYVSF